MDPLVLLALYRVLVPSHAARVDAEVLAWIGTAVRAHNLTSFGAVYAEAMVYYAAHSLQRIIETEASGGGLVGPLLSQRDGDLSRTYAAPATVSVTGGGEFAGTLYGQLYLRLRDSRADTAPFVVI